MGLPPAYHAKDWLQNRHLYMQSPARTNDLIAFTLTHETLNNYLHAMKSLDRADSAVFTDKYQMGETGSNSEPH